MNIKNIVIFCPSKITGGHEYLSVRLADALAKTQPDKNIFYCDYPDGFSHTRWHFDKVRYIDYKGKETSVVIPPDSVVVAQLNLISESERFVLDSENSFIIYWFLHFLNVKHQIYSHGLYFVSKKERKILGEELCFLAEKNIVKCMSYGAYAIMMKDLYQKPKVLTWLPNIAPIRPDIEVPSFSRISNDEIKFCWLGRLDQEKAKNVLTYMNELELINKEHRLSFSIIGVGPAENMLKEEATKYSYPIVFVGEKRDNELDKFIANETEIGLASGTSAFEFSLRGKPVIIEWVIDKVYQAGVRNKYLFVDEDENYDYNSGNELRRVGESFFKQKLDAILNNYEEISKKAYDFVMSKSSESCADNLIRCISSVEKTDLVVINDHEKRVSDIINKAKIRMSPFVKIKSFFNI